MPIRLVARHLTERGNKISPEPYQLSDRLTMSTALERPAAETPDHPFLWFTETGESMTYGAFNESANRVAHGLGQFGVTRGDIVVLVMKTRAEYLIASYALKKIGAVEAGLNRARFRPTRFESTIAGKRPSVRTGQR